MDKFVVKRRRLLPDRKVTGTNDDNKKDQDEPQNKASLKWRKVTSDQLDCDYVLLYDRREADSLLRRCEETLSYNTGSLAKVQVFGKWYDIPRKQVAHGNEGLNYTFSGNTIPARPWTPLLLEIRDKISRVTGHSFNFVLINRYEGGKDHMGEHKDDEKELMKLSPIASLSLGQPRDFVFRHETARGSQSKKKGGSADTPPPPVKLELEHGSLLLMNYPTNAHWYHSLPPRKRLPPSAIRVNMTFRDMVVK